MKSANTGGLTKTQMRVLKLLGDGLVSKEIGEKMKRSSKTVEWHRSKLYEIFPKCSSPMKLARLAIAFGMSALCLMCMAAGPAGTRAVVLTWDNPGTNAGPLTYFAYYTTNAALPATNWPLLSVITNPVSINGGAQLAYTNYLVPGAYFFTMTASNFWGLSSFSGAVGTPQALPQPLLLNLGLSLGQ